MEARTYFPCNLAVIPLANKYQTLFYIQMGGGKKEEEFETVEWKGEERDSRDRCADSAAWKSSKCERDGKPQI